MSCICHKTSYVHPLASSPPDPCDWCLEKPQRDLENKIDSLKKQIKQTQNDLRELETELFDAISEYNYEFGDFSDFPGG